MVARRRIEDALGPLESGGCSREPGVGPANVFRTWAGAGRTAGVHQCYSKPVLRDLATGCGLTASGERRSCLFDGGEVDVMPAAAAGAGYPGDHRA